AFSIDSWRIARYGPGRIRLVHTLIGGQQRGDLTHNSHHRAGLAATANQLLKVPWPGFEPGCLAAPPPQDSVSTSFTTRAGRRKVESVPGGVNRGGAARRSALDWCPMELWVAFGFGALIGAFIGTLIGRHRAAARSAAAPPVVPPPPASRFAPPEVQHVVLDEGSANVLNALNNRLAAIGALAA